MSLSSVKGSINYISLGLTVLVLGLIIYLVEMGLIVSWWWYILVGVGGVLLVDAALRVLTEAGGALARAALGLFLVSVGTAFLYGIPFRWPLFIVVIGVALVLYGTVRVTARK